MAEKPGSTGEKPAAARHAAPPKAIGVVDGIPDRAERRPTWKYAAIFAVFLAWVGVLLYISLAGGAR